MSKKLSEEDMKFSPRILIFDQSSDDRFLLVHYLRYFEFEVYEENSSHNLLQCISKIQPDLVILSETLRPQNGYEVCKMLRAIPYLDGMYIMILLEDNQPANQIRAKQAGADDTVTRPNISDTNYSYHQIAQFVHTNLINKTKKLT